MTLPEWVAPDPPDDTAGGEAPGRPRPDPGLDAKPVLEWTNEDWARWIETAEPVGLPAPETAREEPPEQEPVDHGAGDEPAPDEAVEAEPQAAVEPEAEDPEPRAAPVETTEASPVAASTDNGTDEAAEVPTPPADDDAGEPDWGGVAEHPWWTSAPAPDEHATAVLATPSVASTPTATRVDEPAPLQPVARPAQPAVRRPAAAKPKPKPARARARPAPARARKRRPDDEGEHRVRSALGLLGMAVMTGAILAALITVAVVAVSLVVQRALG
ncbi:MAG TPA: hypothetical protein VFJ85_19570 [Acidimicrobiales bacterium]|nr:hypothetical protein [Acidimicrobiales bacterium]